MMVLYSGQLVNPVELDLSKVELTDVARSLCGQRRWLAHTHEPVTIGQHTMAGAAFLLDQGYPFEALAFLHHDDGEAFFGDLPRDLKNHPEMKWFKEQEELCGRRLMLYFAPLAAAQADMKLVKEVDDRSLLQEALRKVRHREDTDLNAHLPSGDPLGDRWYRQRSEHHDWLRMHATLTNTCEKIVDQAAQSLSR